jgi:hypothetical protein
MRRLTQPGPVHPDRIDMCLGTPEELRFTLKAGSTLNEALTAPMVAAGFQCGTIVIGSAAADPFRYVMPGVADDASHVAYFTAPRSPAGITRIERGNATFGWADGRPSLHCHAAWIEPDGGRRGGHVLPHDTIVASDAEAVAWGFRDIRIDSAADAETNFTLFQPNGGARTAALGVVARVKPNEDITLAVEAIARAFRMPDAVIRGSLGSLIGARFPDGEVADYATEVLVRAGRVRGGLAELDLVVVDMGGRVHEGRLVRGENPVLITFDIFLERDAA